MSRARGGQRRQGRRVGDAGAYIRLAGVVGLVAALAAVGAAGQARGAACFAYVPAMALTPTPSAVFVLDVTTGAVVASYGGTYPNSSEASPGGSFVYVTDRDAANVRVIETLTNSIVATVAVGALPRRAAFSPNGSFAYVPTNGGTAVLSLPGHAIVATIPGTAYAAAVAPNGSLLYLNSPPAIRVVDATTFGIVATVPPPSNGFFDVSRPPRPSPDGSYLYTIQFVNTWFADLVKISTVSFSPVAAVPVGGFPFGFALTPNGSFAYVPSTLVHNLSIVNTLTNSVVGAVSWQPWDGPSEATASPDGSWVYVGGTYTTVLATVTNTVVTTIASGSGRTVFSNDGSWAYLVGQTVFVASTALHQVVASWTIPQGYMMDFSRVCPPLPVPGTPTWTATTSRTRSATGTGTATSTKTRTPTWTRTGSTTPTGTSSSTPTGGASAAATASASCTATGSATGTPTASPTTAGTSTGSATRTVTSAATASATSSGTIAAAPAPTEVACDAGGHAGPYPNPFSRFRDRFVRFACDGSERMTLRIFDVSGAQVAERRRSGAGARAEGIVWDGRGPGGSPVPAGVYAFVLESGRGRRPGTLAIVP